MTATPTQPRTSMSERVAEEIRSWMGRRRITGAGLAKALNVSPAWVSYRLSGKQEIGLNDLEAIARVLEVAPVELLPAAERGLGQTTRQYSPLTEKPMSPRPARGPLSTTQNTRPSGGHPVRRTRRLGDPAAVAPAARAA